MNRTFLGTTSDLGVPNNVYSFSAVLPAAFSASANTKYWFSVFSGAPSGNPLFSWTLGSGGDGFSKFTSTGTTFIEMEGDLAFSLSEAPEPGTFVLLAFGIGGVVLSRRKLAAATRR